MADILQIDIKKETEKFVHAIDGLALTLQMSMGQLRDSAKDAHKQFDDFVERHCEIRETEGKRQFRIPSHDFCHEFERLKTQLDRIHTALRVVPRSFFVALVSQYDAYLGNLLKCLFYLRPELLESSERSLTFAELCRFGNIETAREFILEKEVESLLRRSHTEQFDWLEKKFDLKLRVNLSIWPEFVEITERRNLCVHTDAIASRQYVDVCRLQSVNLNDIKPGNQLEISPKYFARARRIIYEIGVKLGQVLWRKLIPEQAENADHLLLGVIFSLLKEERYKTAQALSNFADTTLQKKHANERLRLNFLVNRALSYYLAGEKLESQKILDSQDWTAVESVFKLAHAVLGERFEDAGNMMRSMGPRGLHKADYLHWPLFLEFRKSDYFPSAFKEIFGDMIHDESEVQQLQEPAVEVEKYDDKFGSKSTMSNIDRSVSSDEASELKQAHTTNKQ